MTKAKIYFSAVAIFFSSLVGLAADSEWQDVTKNAGTTYSSTTTHVGGTRIPKGAIKYRTDGKGGLETIPPLSELLAAEKAEEDARLAVIKAAEDKRKAEVLRVQIDKYASWRSQQLKNHDAWLNAQTAALEKKENKWAITKVKALLAAEKDRNDRAADGVLELVKKSTSTGTVTESWKKHAETMSVFPTTDELYELEERRYPLSVKNPGGCQGVTLKLNSDGTASLEKQARLAGLRSVAGAGKNCVVVAEETEWLEEPKVRKLGDGALWLAEGKWGGFVDTPSSGEKWAKVTAEKDRVLFRLWVGPPGKTGKSYEFDPSTEKLGEAKEEILPATPEFFN